MLSGCILIAAITVETLNLQSIIACGCTADGLEHIKLTVKFLGTLIAGSYIEMPANGRTTLPHIPTQRVIARKVIVDNKERCIDRMLLSGSAKLFHTVGTRQKQPLGIDISSVAGDKRRCGAIIGQVLAVASQQIGAVIGLFESPSSGSLVHPGTIVEDIQIVFVTIHELGVNDVVAISSLISQDINTTVRSQRSMRPPGIACTKPLLRAYIK